MVTSNLPTANVNQKESSTTAPTPNPLSQPLSSPAESKHPAAVYRNGAPLHTLNNENDYRTMTSSPSSQPSQPAHDPTGSRQEPNDASYQDIPAGGGQVPPGAAPVYPDPEPQHSRDDVSRATSRADMPLDQTSGGADRLPEGESEETYGPHAQLAEYRKRLAEDLGMRELSARSSVGGDGGDGDVPSKKTRVSPIQEETTDPPSDNSPAPDSTTATSVESGKTIRGGTTPGHVAATPSYPFPRMSSANVASHHSAQTSIHLPSRSPLSSSHLPNSFFQSGPDSSAASPDTFSFRPDGAQSTPDPSQPGEYPTPNLFELSLMLTAESGLDNWWETVVQIMRHIFKAERVTLSVPGDATDIENVPWCQKATYNEHPEDGLSMGYLAQSTCGSGAANHSVGPSDQSLASAAVSLASPPSRPGLPSRHSFTSFEDRTRCQEEPSRRPGMPSRSKTFNPPEDPQKAGASNIALNQMALEQLAAAEEGNTPTWEAALRPRRTAKARVFPTAQPLDAEADPLANHESIMGTLKRGKVVTLTRTYPYLDPRKSEKSTAPPNDAEKEERRKEADVTRSASTSRKSSAKAPGEHENKGPGRLKTRFDEELKRPSSPKYEEYEQAPQSPWSQSPAPSPAVRSEPKENPFFTDAFVDESSFSPDPAPADYSSMPAPEAIGVDNSSSVLHVPLNHIMLSPSRFPYRSGSVAGASNSADDRQRAGVGTWGNSLHSTEGKLKTTPIAILSILSPVIPYPANLRRSLGHLSMHLATTFALCQYHTKLETEIAGLQKKRPHTPGFGALTSEGRPVASQANLTGAAQLNMEELTAQSSLAGSMTSLSEYSSFSRSVVCSPNLTPGITDQPNLGSLAEKTDRLPTSPLPASEDGYFSAVHRPLTPRGELPRRGKSLKETRSSEKRRTRGSSVTSSQPPEGLEAKNSTHQHKSSDDPVQLASLQDPNLAREGNATPASDPANDADNEAAGQQLPADSTLKTEGVSAKKILKNRHTMLHTYGAEFSTTFPSLPPSSTVSRRTSLPPNTVDMPPPSDRLKGLILDSLPAQIFVALPQTGEVVWVSSRYLSYRGSSVSDLIRDPWGSIHVEDREEYLKAWRNCLRTGEQFSRTVRIRRFDGEYRWFYARAVASRDKRGVIHHFLGSYMDIHEQHVAEIKAARQEQLEQSEEKHKLLANLIPQIIFTATHTEGITSANDQWLSYTGQTLEDSLGLGFMDYVHPDDLARCRIPLDPALRPRSPGKGPEQKSDAPQELPVLHGNGSNILNLPEGATADTHKDAASGQSPSADGKSDYQRAIADLEDLAKQGVIKVTRDSNGRISYTTEVRLRSKTGEYRWHLVRCVEIDNVDLGAGKSSYFGSATDINDHKLLEAKLKEAMDSKSRFLSNMSHEIRTPLIGISGMVSFLQDTELNEEQRDHTNTIQTSANSLLMIINDILDLSKVAAGMMKLKFEWFHTRALIEDVNELVSTMAIAKRLELNYIVDEDVPALVKGDKIRIRQVLLNVIGNAIKFTAEGEVFSRCKVYRGPDTSSLSSSEIMLEFAIIDTGRGFTKEEAELIFKPFSQIDGSSTRQHGGSGLGLVISRQLVELHGGQMNGTAVPGEGSTFTFTAKFGLPTPDDHPDVQPKSPPALADKAKEALSIDTVSPMPSIPARPRRSRASSQIGHEMESEFASSDPQSSGSSNLSSAESGRSSATERSSAPSVNMGLARFSEAAKATGHDISQVTLTMPRDRTPPGTSSDSRPVRYSILIVCPQTHSREATSQHIATTIPKDVPYQITALDSAEEARKLLSADSGPRFTHVVLNLPTAEAIISLVEQTTKLVGEPRISILVLSDTVQRQQVLKLASGTEYEQLLSSPQVSFVYKPVKPSRFAAIFDPDRVQDLSIDRNRSTAQRMVESQKASYLEIVKRMGNKGYKVLLVEDNPVNQKVLTKYLTKVGVGVDIAVDGVACTDMMFSKPYGYYSLVLVSLRPS